MTNGRRRHRSARDDLPPNAEINVTSLIDVAFTLLVIFIITAPMLQGGLEVRLPQGQIRPITAQDDPFIVSVDAEGTIHVGETAVTDEEFASSFPQLLRAASPRAIYLKGDAAIIYGELFPIMALVFRVAQEEGLAVSLLGEPEPQRR